MTANRTEHVRRHYDRSAGSYDRIISWAEKALFGGGREWVCSRARGEVLEIAVGTGRNFPFYPRDVRLTGIAWIIHARPERAVRSSQSACPG
jgi:hypothetical protein